MIIENVKNKKLARELREVINRNSREGESNTPDFVLGEFMLSCLCAYELAVKERDLWHNHNAPPNLGVAQTRDTP